MTKKISVFDADACIKMGKTNSQGYSLLSQLILYFDESYIHEFVYDEINASPSKTHLQDLIDAGLIELFSDKDLLLFLKDVLANNEAVSCLYFQNTMQQQLDCLSSGQQLKAHYSTFLSTTYNDIDLLVRDLSSIESTLPHRTSAGEFKTCVLVHILNFIGLAEINLFVSNDRAARVLLVTSTNGNVNTTSPIGSFFLLRDMGMSYQEAQTYLLGRMVPHTQIRAKGTDDKLFTTTYSVLLFDIYDLDPDDIILTKEGIIKYV